MDFKYQAIAFISVMFLAKITMTKRTHYYNVTNQLRRFKQVQQTVTRNPYKK